jgi:DNA-binding NtrC family response regulator
MKPSDILGFIEEAAGTLVFDHSRKKAELQIRSKDRRLTEINESIANEIAPRLRAMEEQERAYEELQDAHAALERLAQYRWPGNVRELRNAVQRAYVMAAGDVIDEQWLPQPSLLSHAAAGGVAASATPPAARRPVSSSDEAFEQESITLSIGTTLASAERTLILATLRHHHHQKERTAAALGISLKTLYNRLKEYAADGLDHAAH